MKAVKTDRMCHLLCKSIFLLFFCFEIRANYENYFPRPVSPKRLKQAQLHVRTRLTTKTTITKRLTAFALLAQFNLNSFTQAHVNW